jgi:hypothetical protein
VPASEQTIALQYYEEGNREFLESRFAQALAKYREAIAHWDHPAIRFNMAVCLINLGQLIEARESMDLGLAYGADALGEDLYRQGLTYRKLLETQLTRVTIRCHEPLAEVSLDGKHLFTGPGEAARYLLPGDHQVVATKPGFLTASETLTLRPGETTSHEVRLIAFKSTTTMVRRWSRWKPYAVVGAGAAIAAIGGVTYVVSASAYDDYDQVVRRECPAGCSAAEVAAIPELAAAKDRADRYKLATQSLVVVGGAVALVGAVGLYLNQPRARTTDLAFGVANVSGGALVTLQGAF